MVTENMSPIKLVAILITIILFFAYVVVLMLNKQERFGIPPSVQSSVAGCPKDAQICPNGSITERTGPSCDFVPCDQAKRLADGKLTIALDDDTDCDISGFIFPSRRLRIFGDGFLPETSLSVEIKADEGRFTGQFNNAITGKDGEINAIVTIPENIPLVDNSAWIEVAGMGPHEKQRVLRTPVKIIATTTADQNGDGVLDICAKNNK